MEALSQLLHLGRTIQHHHRTSSLSFCRPRSAARRLSETALLAARKGPHTQSKHPYHLTAAATFGTTATDHHQHNYPETLNSVARQCVRSGEHSSPCERSFANCRSRS
eukprot:6464304-Amphidinium_carterae.1